MPICSILFDNINPQALDLNAMFYESSSDDDMDPLLLEKMMSKIQIDTQNEKDARTSYRKCTMRKGVNRNKEIKRVNHTGLNRANLKNLMYFDHEFADCELSTGPIKSVFCGNFDTYSNCWKTEQKRFFLAFAHAKRNFKPF